MKQYGVAAAAGAPGIAAAAGAPVCSGVGVLMGAVHAGRSLADDLDLHTL